MAKTEKYLLSMNSTMTETEFQDAVDLDNASFVQVFLSICAFFALESTLFSDWWIH